MIKIIKAEYIAEKQIRLLFSDQSWGEYNFQSLIDRQAELVIPLQDDGYFADFFLELGALCWKNGFELSAGSLHRKLQEQGLLHSHSQAA